MRILEGKYLRLSLAFFKEHLGASLFVLMIIVACFSFTEYGVAWDEKVQTLLGYDAYNYIVDGDKSYLTNKDKDYGVFFELVLTTVQSFYSSITGLNFVEDFNQNSNQIYLLRHFISHLFFLLAALFAYKIAFFLYKNKWLAAIAFFLVVLQPRLYSHSFFNTKDIPFFCMLIISFYYTLITLSNKTIKNIIVLGVCVGILINIRIMGIMLPCFIVFFFLLDMLKDKEYIKNLKLVFIFLGTATFVLYITWPYLWNNPIENFITSFNNMKNFRYGGAVLFGGKVYRAYDVPNSYIPIWFSITTPITYILFGLLGIVLITKEIILKNIAFLFNAKKRFFLICLALFISPIILVIIFNSTLYNGWRQMYFIYAGFIFIAIKGIHFLYNKNKKILFLPLITFIVIGFHMIFLYPNQHVFFNYFISTKKEDMETKYDMDYFGVSMKQAYEFILERNKTSKNINIFNCKYSPLFHNFYTLKERHKSRIGGLKNNINDADYFILPYGHRFYFDPKKHPTNKKISKLYSLKKQGNTLFTIYRLSD